mgnify:FL=1
MSKKVFHNKTIVLDGKEIVIENKSIKDIFKFGAPPYVICGVTQSGKTTLCLDIIYKYAKECTNVYYITGTQETIRDDTISKIPQCYRVKPTLENIVACWEDIVAANDAAAPPLTKLEGVFAKLYGKTDATSILSKLQERSDKLKQERYEKYKENKLSEIDAKNNSEVDSKAFRVEVLSRLIVDKYTNANDISQLSDEDMLIIQSLVSMKPKSIFIMDDITSELNQMQTKRNPIMIHGQLTPAKDVYKTLLLDILTKARHYNMICCIFLHTLDMITSKEQLMNIIFMNNEATQKVFTAKTISETLKKLIKESANALFKGQEYPYYFLYINVEKKSASVSKADLHPEEIEFDEQVMKFIDVYNKINNKIAIEDDTPQKASVDFEIKSFV